MWGKLGFACYSAGWDDDPDISDECNLLDECDSFQRSHRPRRLGCALPAAWAHASPGPGPVPAPTPLLVLVPIARPLMANPSPIKHGILGHLHVSRTSPENPTPNVNLLV